MLRKKKGKIEWLEFELFAPFPELTAAVFLRHGGISDGHYTSLNAGSHGDLKENTEENYRRIAKVLTTDDLCLDILRDCFQMHGDDVVFFSENDDWQLKECDGMITSCLNKALVVRHADCQAAIFFDPITKTIACVHAGWRGQIKNIYRKTIEKMSQRAGCKPEHLLVAVSPSLCPSHSEFIHFRQEWPEPFWSFQIRPTYFDLWAISKHQLLEAGIQPQNMQFAEICTYCHPEDFFSYRREKPTGNHATVAYLQ
jgi:polyphenol oxidase